MDRLVILPLFSVFGEGLLLGVHPVLVKSSLEFSGQMLGPDGGQGSETAGGFNISDNTTNNDGRSFKNGTSFNGFLLVELYAF